ncbi:hypothetical protein B0T10DRAFT_417469, partial [Thelonectria olida]
MSAQNQVRNRGHISDSFDPADKPYYYDGPPIDQARFNGIINLWDKKEDYLRPIYNQSSTNSCVANATAAAVRFLVHALINKQGHDESLHSVEDPSRLFIYYLGRAYGVMEKEQAPWEWPVSLRDTGCRIRNAFKSAHAYGIASEKKWPWYEEAGVVIGLNDRPVDAAFVGNKLVNGIEYCRLDPDHTADAEKLMGPEEKASVGAITLFRLRQCLYEGYPVVFGFKFYWPTFPATHKSLTDEFPSLGPLPTWAWQPAWGSHAVLAVGYDHTKQRVLIQNSWGDGTNGHAHFWMPYDWIKSFEATEDFWMVR